MHRGRSAGICSVPERTVRKAAGCEIGGKLVERESRIAMEAAKQCGRSYVPQGRDIVTLEKAAEELQNKKTV